jgi:hypothetical protein
MWSIPKPTRTLFDTFDLCISRIADPSLKSRMINVRQYLILEESRYDKAAKNTDLHLIVSNTSIGNGLVSGQEMEGLYTGRMAAIGSPGRQIYDEILISSDNSRCPFCGHRDVSTLDHILAKSKFPEFTITPWNLVPCCADCNKAKGSISPTSKDDQFLHPYYDSLDRDAWLCSEIIQSKPAGVAFYVRAPTKWTQVTKNRVHHQFRKLGIAKLYAAQGGRELSNIRQQMTVLFDRAGQVAVKDHLTEAYESRSAVNLNSWQTAFYRAASKSIWYCEGGFRS